MSLSILNNVAALYAQNNLSTSQSKLQGTLQQLSSGSRINSGADDPSGLAVADGLAANVAALSQSSTNATEGIGMLQTADGALSQVTSLLTKAVTIATEIGGGTLTAQQIGSANSEYANILTQINNIGSHTNYNSSQVFSSTAVNINVTDGTSSGTNSYSDTVGALSTSNVGSSVGVTQAQVGGVASSVTTLGTFVTGVTGTTAASAALTFGNAGDSVGGSVNFAINSLGVNLKVTANSTLTSAAAQMTTQLSAASAGVTAAVVGAKIVFTATAQTTGDTMAASTANLTDTTAITTAASSTIGVGTDLATSFSTISTSNSTAAAQAFTNAISTVAYQRGTLGADINQLSSAASVASAESVNLSSAQNAVTATDYGAAASNLSKYQILSQTGISALAQANSVQQEVLKLLQ